jgi:tripartite-type tricarboxylate transporter receptor subunit TctC
MKRLRETLAIAIALIVTAASAADFPSRPVRWIVPSPPGGGTDAVGRIVGAKLSEFWGQQVIIDNRSGAQGSVGTAIGAKSVPDGYTLTFVYTGPIAVNPHLYADPGYNALRDFAPISRLTQQSMIMTAHPSTPVKTLKELAAYAKQNPGKLTFASSASGQQLAGELFKLTTGTDIVHIPYKGAGPAVLDLLAGNVNIMVSNPTSIVPHVKSGKLRALGVLGNKRIEALPEVPSAAEAGYPELSDVTEWYGVVAPAATPRPAILALNAAFVRALATPDVLQRLQALGMNASPSTPEDFAKQMREDYARWGKHDVCAARRVHRRRRHGRANGAPPARPRVRTHRARSECRGRETAGQAWCARGTKPARGGRQRENGVCKRADPADFA